MRPDREQLPFYNYPLAVIGEALKSTAASFIIFFGTAWLGAVIATYDFDEPLGFVENIWMAIGLTGLSLVGFWGILFLVLEVWCLYCLLYTDRSRFHLSAILLLSWTVEFSIASSIFDITNGGINWLRVAGPPLVMLCLYGTLSALSAFLRRGRSMCDKGDES